MSDSKPKQRALIKAPSRAVVSLRNDMARRGLSLLKSNNDAVATETGSKGYDSEFERQVARALVAQGFQVHTQIGVAGFFIIDLAIVDPDQSGHYLLGIECNGEEWCPPYRSARDRDRIRQQFLEDQCGWIIHRILATDWVNRPEDELRKVTASIEKAKAIRASHSIANGQSQHTKVHSANIRKPRYIPPAEVHEALSAIVGGHIGITIDEAATEIGRLFGFGATSSQLRKIVQDGTTFLIKQNMITQRNGKLYIDESSG